MQKNKNLILNTIRDNCDKKLYKDAWDSIKILGEDSAEVDRFLVPYEHCEDSMDFILAFEGIGFPRP